VAEAGDTLSGSTSAHPEMGGHPLKKKADPYERIYLEM
jgi:hypothetical protein